MKSYFPPECLQIELETENNYLLTTSGDGPTISYSDQDAYQEGPNLLHRNRNSDWASYEER